ncbi:MAG: 23S rRNA (pseudouridine(1915)-N(3))-methyltransferase RlmH [Pseudomonadota bacterium]
MKILLLPIGKIKSKAVAAICADYAKRLNHYIPFEIKECKDEAQLLERLESSDHFVALDERGDQLNSEALSGFISKHQMRGTKRLVFAIGGPEGFTNDVLKRADYRLSLSGMTFPHELVQAIILEQLYRACTILKGEPYHK